MIDKIKKVFSFSFIRFAMVGVANTIIGTSVMFIAYNLFHAGYWVSSALNYVVGSVFSYFANKYFTFSSKKKSLQEIIRFAINILVCYFIAYGIARPLIQLLCDNIEIRVSQNIMEQISMVLGMMIFIIINYLGQRLFVFKDNEKVQHGERGMSE